MYHQLVFMQQEYLCDQRQVCLSIRSMIKYRNEISLFQALR